MKFGKKIAATLLGILCTGCLAGGLTACSTKGPTGTPDDATTIRLALPNDGSAPTAHTGLENIGYIAYALDKKDYYHVYANCSSKAMGYTQITQSWKDYKDNIMICSDITYSSLAKAGTQACFVNNEVYMRASDTPGKSTISTTAKWKTSKPTYYTRDEYLTTYGEFSTELCTYIINAETIKSCGEVVVNDDGTYSQSFSLNSKAASYYQYGMKTRGDLKGFPEFNSIEITFTFDGNWTVLSSYCVEKATIAPSALGGIPADSTSKITTTYSYGADEFDSVHYDYYESYFKQYIGKVDEGPGPGKEHTVLDVLGSAFGGVIAHGEQYDLDLTVGQTEYDGKIYLSIASLEDVLNNIDARIALGKEGSQDLYINFAEGAVNAYYSDDFAMTLNVDAVSTIINQFSDWASRFKEDGGVSAAAYALTDGETGEEPPEEQSDGLDIASLLSALKLEEDESTATVSIVTDDLLGTGIGVKAYIYCDRPDEDTYVLNYVELESIAYDSTSIDLHVKITPDNGGAVISRNKAETPANLADYATGVYSMLDSETLKVSLDFDGTKQDVISLLQGLTVKADAYVELGYNLATRVDLDIDYAGLSAALAVYYGNNIDFKSAGKVYIDLLSVNGEEFGARVYCDIDKTVEAVKDLLDLINGNAATANLTESQSEEAANSVATMINGILNLDFGKVLGDIYASNSQIRVNADIDMIVDALGVNVNGIKFGTAALALGLEEGKSNLSLSLAKLGLKMTVEGSEEELSIPDKENYLDAIELVELVSVAVKESKYIIDAQTIAFEINAYVVIDGVPMHVVGSGEVNWANGLKIAVDVVMNIADGTSTAAKDEVALKLFYDSAAEEGQPFIKFAVNELGMEIYDKDISDTKNGVQNIIDNINLLLNGEKSGNATAAEAAQLYNTSVALDGGNAGSAVEEVIESENLQNILGVVLGFVKDLTISTDYNVDDGSVSKLVLQHALLGNITLTANGGLSLDANITDSNGTVITELAAGVSVGDGTAFDSVNAALAECEIYSTEQMDGAFAKIVYNYLFAVVEDLSVSETLGSDTYEVAIFLDGAKSGIKSIKDVKVDAKLYYTQGLAGNKIKGDKLAEINLDINIGTTTAKANVRYNNEKIYISLNQLGNTSLTDVSFYADKDELSSAVEQLVKIINNENVITTLSNMLHPTADNNAADNGGVAVQADEDAVSDLLTRLISFDFASSFSYKKVSGVNTATVNVDNLLELFGADSGFAIGTAEIGVNPQTHAITGGVTLNGQKWVTLSAQVTERRAYNEGWQNGYIDIGFISTFVDDLIKTAITDGELNTLYTLGGNIDIDIKYSVISTSVNIKNVKLTAGLDENKKFYFTLTGELQSSTYLLQTVAQKWNIAVTYSNGYITMGREVGTAKEKFKVMTLDYLLANLLHKENSPIRWLLGTGGTPWGLIADNVKLNLGSSLTKPQEYWLYKENVPEPEPNPDETVEITEFILKDILAGMKIVIDGQERETSTYGDTKSILAGSGDYYGFDVNMQSLLGDTLSHVYLTILRGNDGLTGLKVNTTVAGALTVDVNLDQGISTKAEDAQPDYYKEVSGKHTINYDYYDGTEDPVTHISKTFGCYNTENGTYDSLNILGKVNFTVVGYGDLVESQSVSLRSTSTVYLRDPDNAIWANDEHTLMITFVDGDGKDLGTQTQITRDTTVYATTTAAAEVVFDMRGVADNYTKVVTMEQPFANYEGELTDKTFKNWVDNDGNVVTCANDIPVVNGERRAYANFVSQTTTVNGVVYKAVSENGTVYYTADSVDSLDGKYTKTLAEGGEYLVLESEINGIPVTHISASAFKGTFVKNVIVPESITEVGAQAFMDNYGIENVAFAADTVNLHGDSTSGDNRYVFFGCSVTNGGNTTNLNVYYNNINGEGTWEIFRGSNRIGTSAGGKLSNVGWSYVVYNQDGADLTQGLDCLTGALQVTVKSSEQIKADVVAELNANSVSKGYINAYGVTVDSGVVLNGKINTVTVTLEDATPYWLLTINSNREGAIVDGEVEVYGGNRYVMAGATVTVNPPDGYVFTKLTGIEHSEGTFVMPGNALTLEAECDSAEVNSYILNSAVETFTMGGVEYHNGEELSVDIALSTNVHADGYYFLGWAYNNGREYEFVSGGAAEYNNYYAIWAVVRDEISSVAPATNGSDPNAATVTHNASLAAGFEGWYTSTDFTSKVTTLTSTEPLHARMNYTLTYHLNGNGDTFFFVNKYGTELDNKNNAIAKAKSYTGTVSVLEGTDVTCTLGDNNTLITLSNNGADTDLRGKQVSWTGGVSSSRKFTLVDINSENGWENNTKLVKGNFEITATF